MQLSVHINRQLTDSGRIPGTSETSTQRHDILMSENNHVEKQPIFMGCFYTFYTQILYRKTVDFFFELMVIMR